ncbi:MAG: acetoacetate--CoA ligase, partial [Myxococcota bacterium]
TENVFRYRGDALAVIARTESGGERRFTRDELYALTARLADGLRRQGVSRGDRVVGLLPNGVEALAAFLAAASLGATWSCCSPEFGVASVLDRFRQIEPKALFAVDHYHYGGKRYDRSAELGAIVDGLPSLEVAVVAGISAVADGLLAWDDFLGEATEIRYERVPFAHPLWVLYSSGTTGLPKAIVHGHGGIVLEHLKAVSLHCDLGERDRFFWFTTTGWMMWNFVVGGLLVGSTVVLYDGHPTHPGPGALWSMAAELEVGYFGTSAPFLLALQKAGYVPRSEHDLSSIRAIGSTGAPLPAAGFGWVYDAIGSELVLGSVSGGTDICTAFVLSCPWLPVHAGEIQCAGLGCDVQAWSPDGQPVLDAVGELVLTQPIPSMPTHFWGDPDGARLRGSYFSSYDGIWRHGDWVKQTGHGGFVIYGRSDSTLNRGGVRMGTSEFYRVVESRDEIADSLVVDTSALDQTGTLWLFVVLAPGVELDSEVMGSLKKTIRSELSPRHVPDEIRAVKRIPRTLNGKKLEVPIKKLFEGVAVERAVNLDTVDAPEALEAFVQFAGSDAGSV